jgi:hypothetical protein
MPGDLVPEMEPEAHTSRPTREMPNPSSPHASHDVLILAAAADHDPDPETLAEVERMTAECADCAAIADDLRLLASGLATLPPEVPAPRDFRITEEQAARLRRRGLARRILEPFGVGGLPGLSPFGGALTAIGLAGILLTSVFSGTGVTSVLQQVGTAVSGAGAGAAEAPAPAPSTYAAHAPEVKDNASPPAVDTGTNSQAGSGGARGSFEPQAVVPSQALGGAPPNDDRTNAVEQPGPSPWALASVVLLVLGVVLLSLRLVARRLD